MFDAANAAPHNLMQNPAFAAAFRACRQTPLYLPGGLMVVQRRLFGLLIAVLPRARPPPDTNHSSRTLMITIARMEPRSLQRLTANIASETAFIWSICGTIETQPIALLIPALHTKLLRAQL